MYKFQRIVFRVLCWLFGVNYWDWYWEVFYDWDEEECCDPKELSQAYWFEGWDRLCYLRRFNISIRAPFGYRIMDWTFRILCGDYHREWSDIVLDQIAMQDPQYMSNFKLYLANWKLCWQAYKQLKEYLND